MRSLVALLLGVSSACTPNSGIPVQSTQETKQIEQIAKSYTVEEAVRVVVEELQRQSLGFTQNYVGQHFSNETSTSYMAVVYSPTIKSTVLIKYTTDSYSAVDADPRSLELQFMYSGHKHKVDVTGYGNTFSASNVSTSDSAFQSIGSLVDGVPDTMSLCMGDKCIKLSGDQSLKSEKGLLNVYQKVLVDSANALKR